MPNLDDAIKYFSDEAMCHRYLESVRWPDGVTCPSCKSDRVGAVASRNLYRCKDCRSMWSLLKGTICESSLATLGQWFVVIYAVANSLEIGTHELAEAIGVTQKTAWRLRTVIKTAMGIV